MNNSPLVREEVRQKVMQAAAELNYVPSHAARTLAGRKQNTVGVIFPDIDSGFYAEVLRGMDQAMVREGFHLLVAFSHGEQDEEQLLRRFALEGRVDAVVLMNLLLEERIVADVAKCGTPLVLIDREAAGLDAVMIDNVDGASAAMEHLLSHGYQRIALISGPEASFDARQRLEGCRKALAKHGGKLDERLVASGAFREEGGKAAMETLLLQKPDAVVACNDAMALGAMETLRAHGLRVPEDVAVIGFDDIPVARHVGLTTVHVPLLEIGHRAAEAALRRIGGSRKTKRQMIPAQLVVRASCGCKAKEKR